MSCQIRYTLAQAIATLYTHFIIEGRPPALNSRGEPVYQITGQHGCAVFVLAGTEFRKRLAEIGTHEACPASRLSEANIDPEEILDISGLWMNAFGFHNFPVTAQIALSHLQWTHDEAALVARRWLIHGSFEMDIPAFRERLVKNLRGMMARFHVNEADVIQALPTVPENLPQLVERRMEEAIACGAIA